MHWTSNLCTLSSIPTRELTIFEEIEQRTIQGTKGKGIWCKFDWGCLFNNHGDLVTELFNKETKGTCGSFCYGFNKIDLVNSWVNTINTHTMLKVALIQQ